MRNPGQHPDGRPRGGRPAWSTASATLALSVVLAGCGSGGDADAYVKTYEDSCKHLQTAVADFQKSVAQAAEGVPKTQPEKAFPKVKVAASALYGRLGEAFGALADADAPSEYADFQDSVESGADGRREAFAAARTAAERSRTLKDITAVGAKAGGADLGSSQKIPGSLAERAPSCASFGTPAS